MVLSFKKRRFNLSFSTIILTFISFSLVPASQAQTSTVRLQQAQEIAIVNQAYSANIRNGKRAISLEDIKLALKKEKAKRHSQNLLKVLQMDLDGDGFVTSSEADSFANDRSAQAVIKGVKRPIKIQDVIRNPERLNSVIPRRNSTAPVDAEALFKRFDENNDGELTSDEIRSVSQFNRKKTTSVTPKITDEERKEYAVLTQANAIARSASTYNKHVTYRGGVLTKEAFDAGGKIYLSSLRQDEMKNIMHLDLNGDGSLSKTELNIISDPQYWRKFPVLLKLNESGKKPSYSYRQMAAVADKIVLEKHGELDDFEVLFNHLDTDESGVISSDEISDAKQRHRDLNTRTRYNSRGYNNLPLNCDFPKAGKNAEIVMLGTYEGRALSKIKLGQTGRDTSTARLNIEEGETPLYIVASSYDSLLWVVSGATDRIEKFVIQSEKSGVVGVPKDHIHFAPSKCMKYFYDTKKVTKKHSAARAISNHLGGAEIDHILGAYAIADISIPSGTRPKINRKSPEGTHVSTGPGRPDYILTPEGPIYLNDDEDYKKLSGLGRPKNVSSQFWYQYTRYHPDTTLTKIALKDVVSKTNVEYLDVLPQWHGILQLINEGKLEEVKGQRATFRVLKSIDTFPSGLAGGYSVTFLVPDGVSVPHHGYSHSRIKYDDGRCVGATCGMFK